MTTLFDPPPIEVPETIDPNKDYHAELVGDGKKYKDDAALARAKAESDAFIKRLENETKALRDALTKAENEVKTRTSLDDFLQKVSQAQNEPPATRSNPDNHADQTVLSEEKITQIVESRLSAKEKASIANSNLRIVTEGLQQALGPNYVQALEAKTQELGLDKETLDNLAKTAPKAFFALIGITAEQKQSIFRQPESSVRSPQSTAGVKNAKYYENLRKTLPASEYWSPRLQNEIFESRKTLGEDF